MSVGKFEDIRLRDRLDIDDGIQLESAGSCLDEKIGATHQATCTSAMLRKGGVDFIDALGGDITKRMQRIGSFRIERWSRKGVMEGRKIPKRSACEGPVPERVRC